ncbi:MAG: NAD(P)-dependent oxidoreductase, partial [Dehalococcoidia bacterium]|nr:NAD(P)-dependent oxidoreductase [Dehalococcoidia bacterium]
MTPGSVFIPGPNDRLGPLLKDALGPDAELVMAEGRSTESDTVGAQALVLGPGAEAAWELAARAADVRFVQFTGCRPPTLAAETLLANGTAVANAGLVIAPFVAKQTLSLMRTALTLTGRTERQFVDLVVGIIGLGNVGFAVARELRESGASIIYHDIRTPIQGYADEVGAHRQSLDRLLLNSDIVTLHVSDTPHTPGLIGARELRLMKPGAVLVNTSLPGAMDEDAVASSLASGTPGAVALGVIGPRADGQAGPLSTGGRVIKELEDATDQEAALNAIAGLVADNLKRVEA